MSSLAGRADLPAVVVIAHDKPKQLRRLVDALDPLPIFLHVDAGAPAPLFAAMTDGLPGRVRLLPRLLAGWARFEVVEAELLGYRAALEETAARHVVLATGADYPLLDVSRLVERLDATPDTSYAEVLPLPMAAWGPFGGLDRLVLRNVVWRRRRLAWPIPRRIPRELAPAGGAQTKILTRRHARLVLDVLDERPDLLRFFRRCWTPDEVMIPTLLNSPAFGADWSASGSSEPHPWHIDWGDGPAKNPRWLTLDDLPELREAARRDEVPAMFARKFAEDSDVLCAAVDRELRTVLRDAS